MILRGSFRGQPITSSLKRGALTLALDRETVLVVDRAGRLWSYYVSGHHFRRGLNGSILAKWTSGQRRQRRRLWPSEAELVVRCTSRLCQEFRQGFRLDPSAAPWAKRELRLILRRAAAFDLTAARADVAHYHRVYRPIGILPPDQYLAVVLQVTEGCSFNTCTFCSFYKDRPFRIKSPNELRTHIAQVREFLGESILMRQGVFLADANALVVPQPQMLRLLEVIIEQLGERLELHAFLDGFSGRKKGAQDYAALAARGLRRVYIGLESGHDPLLEWVRKPGCADDAIKTVRQIKAGGVNVGVIVMLGLGGRRFAEGHVRDTVAVLNRMRLDTDDLLYFSYFFPFGTPYEGEMEGPDLAPLPQEDMQAQMEAIIRGLVFGEKPPRIAIYDIREFVY
jgi:hypothetical protein